MSLRILLALAALAFAGSASAQQTLGTISNFSVSVIALNQTNTWTTNAVPTAVITPKILEARGATSRKWLRVQNVGSPTVTLHFGTLTNAQSGLLVLTSNSVYELPPEVRWNGPVSARSQETNGAPSASVYIWEGY